MQDFDSKLDEMLLEREISYAARKNSSELKSVKNMAPIAYSPEEIAKVCGVETSFVKNIISTALSKIKKGIDYEQTINPDCKKF